MALRQHGGIVFRHWSPRTKAFLPWFRGRMLGLLILQSYWNYPRVLLLHVRTTIWIATNGPVAILVWLVRSQDQYVQSTSVSDIANK